MQRYQNDYQYVYNLASQVGSKHTLKFGADIRHIHKPARGEL